MRIALAQINPTVGDFTGNAEKIRTEYRRAAEARVDVVIFPELAVCGYPPADLLDKESFVAKAETTLQALAALTAEAGSPAILCGCVLRSEAEAGKKVRNVAAVLEGGEVRFVQQKKLLPYYDVFDEQRYFEAAERQSLTMIAGQPVAITICEDAWNDKLYWPQRHYVDDPVGDLMRQWEMLPPHLGAHRLIVNISASPFWRGKMEMRRGMLQALAKRHHATVVFVNQVGANDSLIFDGSSFVVDGQGRITAAAAEFAEDFVVVDTEVAMATEDSLSGENLQQTARVWEALVLGTRDYVRKCGFSKVLVGLSGGIDSALVATLAVEALGKENVQGIGMPSEFSSEGSVSDAAKLAKNLGIAFDVLPVREIYTSFIDVLRGPFGDSKFGLAEENLQPRIRGSLLMALSNKSGALVLTTGNKSEMATGYCTLYGDMVGALAVIGDVYKTEVYALSRHANREREIIPQDTLTKAPSAELRPGQKDTDSLPPYDVLDPVLRAYIEEYKSAADIAASQSVDESMVRSVIDLVERSEYKRQQAASVLKVSRKSFGMGRRFPIAVKIEG